MPTVETVGKQQAAVAVWPMEALENRMVLYGISWDQYEALQNVFEGRHIRLTYDKGVLEIMTTGPIHEGGKNILGRLLEVLSLELDIPVAGYGEMTWKRKKMERGLESDECYFIKNEPRTRDPKKIHPDHGLVPDLAIEVEISNRLGIRRGIYAALGVPELWCFDGEKLVFLHLTAAGEYEKRERSASFPFLKSADLERFLLLHPQKSQHEVVKEFQSWVRQHRKA